MLAEPPVCLRDLLARTLRRCRAVLLEGRPDREQRDDREDVRQGVEKERHEPRDAEERPAERRRRELNGRDPRLLAGGGPRKLRRRDDRTQRAGLRDVEQGEERSLDERDGDDLAKRGGVQRERRDEAADREGTAAVGEEHQPPPVPAVGGEPRGHREEHVREELCEADDARLRRRPREREDEQRVRDPRRFGAERRERLADLQQDEVAVAAKRDGRHARTMRKSPLTVFARSRTSGPSFPAPGSSESGTSESSSPDTELASTCSREPLRTPTSTSPETLTMFTSPPSTTTLRSPETVFALTPAATPSTCRSPETLFATSRPSTVPTWTSPDTVLTSTSPATSSILTSPLAVATLPPPYLPRATTSRSEER